MCRRAALALLLLVAPGVARAVNGRLSFSLLTGVGYASDVFLGAGLGSGGLLQVTPGGRLDLSFAPQWKLAAVADVTYGHYVSSGLTSLVETAALEGRYIADAVWDAAVTVGVENGSYSVGSPLDPSIPGSPSVVSTLAGRLSPLLRIRALGFEWRAAGLVGARSSTGAAGEEIPEYDYALLAGLMYPLGRSATLAVTYKLAHDDSSRADVAFTAHAAFALLSWRVGELDLQAQLQLQTAAFATGTREDLGRLTLSASHPVSESLDVEVVYSLAASQSDDPSRPSATLHLAFLALRWRFAEVRW